jgi:c-di-GMP-binding flagellar brake protein YcgR
LLRGHNLVPVEQPKTHGSGIPEASYMEDTEIITGSKMLDLLDQLKRERTTLNLYIPGTGYEGLSIMLGVERINGIPCINMDFPTGIGPGIFLTQGKKVIIEFIDKNKIHYHLRSIIEGVSRQSLDILLPDVVHRLQRRKFFRIPPPISTRIIINEKNRKYEFDVIDISEGGALISHPAAFHDDSKFFKGAFKSLIISYRKDDDMQTIKVDKAEIKRIIKAWRTGCYNYALQFVEHGKKEENDIRNFIYSYQRRLIRKRRIQEEEDMF